MLPLLDHQKHPEVFGCYFKGSKLTVAVKKPSTVGPICTDKTSLLLSGKELNRW